MTTPLEADQSQLQRRETYQMTLFEPFLLRGVTLKNRVVVSPMSQYRAQHGVANDWHLVHLGRFALGGAALVFCEATAVQEHGRRTHGDLGIWSDAHIDRLAAVTRFLSQEGAVAGIQLAHAGRKASERRPWHGETPVDSEDIAQRGEKPWAALGPSAIPYAEGWPAPAAMSIEDIREVIASFRIAAERAREAGFRVIEVYAAHGFLIHQFYSPLANQRRDDYGGSLEGRCRLALEIAAAIREVWPDEYPLVFRLSVTDWHPEGWQVDDTIYLAQRLKDLGVDAIDCSSGGISGRERPQGMTLEHGYQLALAARVHDRRHVRLGLARLRLPCTQRGGRPAGGLSQPQAPIRSCRCTACRLQSARSRQGPRLQESERRGDKARAVPVELSSGGLSWPLRRHRSDHDEYRRVHAAESLDLGEGQWWSVRQYQSPDFRFHP
ncbi:NADH:flavin oxidoreductase/NADH oxidase [Brevundimonas sp.]|uniref:NADH:flavin oxidoreductase/NADH oxidase n=1 Tax=Brevundimonas sp. TaxID=1871086 RepID=UPI00289F4ECB|nr:NADH:flavin oxidoreductase/NADH oxidase [Brevundimonas sp.]